MKHLVTGTEMKLLDNQTSNHFHVPEVVLMEQAAMGFVQHFFSLNTDFHLRKGIVFCGSGNNGGDGIAIARLLNERGIYTEVCYVPEVYHIQARYSELYSVQKNIYDAYNFPVVNISDVSGMPYDFVIDAIFGTGLSRELSHEYIQVINAMNDFSALKFAVDIPSGICSDNGKVLGAAVRCDYTITFSFEKIGHFLWPGNEYTGKLICVPIGITEKSWLNQTPSAIALEWADLCHLPKRMAHSNKGTYGKLLIIAGTKNMAGAAILAAKAAYRTGAGLVKVYTREENRVILQTAVPEAILATYKDAEYETLPLQMCGALSDGYGEFLCQMETEDSENVSPFWELKEHLEWADAVVLGPGIGTSRLSEELVFEVIKNVRVPLLLDADALNILSKDTQKLYLLQSKTVITPHLGEMARLTGKKISQIQQELINNAVCFAYQYHITCVLKDFRTIIAQETKPIYLNLSGNNGMATAGSGDVLTGIIGTFLAQGMMPEEAAAYGVFLHGVAGDMAVKKTGTHGMCAQDIIEGLKEIWNKVEHNGNQ